MGQVGQQAVDWTRRSGVVERLVSEPQAPGVLRPAAGPSAPRRPPRLFRIVRAIAVALLALDVGSLWLLLWRLGVPAGWALGLAFAVGGLTSYQAQFRHLLSAREFRHHRSPGRHVAMAVVVLLLNSLGLWLVAKGLFGGYLAQRLLTALLVVWAWGRREGPRLLGDGLAALRQRLADEPAPRCGPGEPPPHD
ncbi:MAG: hypothetical protein KatS3mg102_0881 [Planctomycetota bacterium]|nr:MAG: hypothetical protein KatS3mg102_0881 [Planctomycetota bacterium]